MKTMQAKFNGLRRDLTEGREWLVTTHDDPSGKGHAYVVTIWVEPELGRVASCQCDGFTKGGRCCRHILFIRVSDSILYNVKCREIRPVPFEYAKAA